MKKVCCDCKKELPLSEFWKNSSTKDGHQSVCKRCMSVRNRKYQRENPEKIREHAKKHYRKYAEEKRIGDRIRMNNRQVYLDTLKTPCVKCGESRPYLIQFHHINPSTKTFGVGDGSNAHKSKDAVISEVKKCVCLCANCHAEFHHLYGNKPKNPVDDLKEYLGRDDES